MSSQAEETTRLLPHSDVIGSTGGRGHATGSSPPRSKRVAYPALSDHPDAKVKQEQTSGPVSFFNSTQARFEFPKNRSDDASAPSSSDGQQRKSLQDGLQLEWRARDNRKGRHRLIVSPSHMEAQSSNNRTAVARGIWRMFTVFAYWDVSWWIGVFFSVGCALFIVMGVINVLKGKGFSIVAGEHIAGIAAFTGATLFTFAGVLMVPEAINENQTGCFGWAVEDTISGDNDAEGSKATGKACRKKDSSSARVRHLECQHHHNPHGFHLQHSPPRWKWWPTWHEFRAHYSHDLGFLSNLIFAIGTIIFWVSGILSLPFLSDRLSPEAMKWSYWLAFFVGGLHFATASILIMLESQTAWYKPNPRSLSWWIGFWDLVGSVGWTLSASFGGYGVFPGNTFQSHVTLLWASIAFELGSLLLWYEALDKYPVEKGE